MIDKTLASIHEAIKQITDGSTVMIGGFGTAGQPAELIDALIAHGAKNLTVVNNNAGNGDYGLAALLKAGQVKKIICSFPRQSDSYEFDKLYYAKKIELELVPRVTWLLGFKRLELDWVRFIRQLGMARYWLKAKKIKRLMVKDMFLSIRSKRTLP